VEPYGSVESVTIIKNHQTQKSKGCGFVKFIYREDAMDAFLGLKNNYRKWVVEWATSSNDPDALGVDKFNIFIGGLNPVLVTKQALEERFQLYGPIENTTLIKRDDSLKTEHRSEARLHLYASRIRPHRLPRLNKRTAPIGLSAGLGFNIANRWK